MGIQSSHACGDGRANWVTVTATLRSMQACLGALEKQLAETLAMAEGELKLTSDTEVPEAVPSTAAGEPPDTENVARAGDGVALVKCEVIASEEITDESLIEPKVLLARPAPATVEYEASSCTETAINGSEDATAGHDQHSLLPERESTKSGTATAIENTASATTVETPSSAATALTPLEPEAISTPPECTMSLMDIESTKFDVQPEVESPGGVTNETPLCSETTVIGSDVEALPTQFENTVVFIANRRLSLLRSLAVSAAACLMLSAGLVLTNPDALAELSSLVRVASVR